MEVIWHARGGQGAFTAARCLGAAATLSAGMEALAFPTFGPERRGAPVCAYTKIGKTPLGDRSAVRRADIVVYLDETLFEAGWERECAKDGLVLLNASHPSVDPRVLCLDADALSREVLGRAIPNTAFLGAIAALSDVLDLEDIHCGIRASMPSKLQQANISIVDAAYGAVTECREKGSQVQPRRISSQCSWGQRKERGQHRQGAQGPDSRPPSDHTPTLRDVSAGLPPTFADSTCFQAGHLVSENAGWRSERPVIDADGCTTCLNCYQFCPDGTIFKVRGPEGAVEGVAIDYAFCKGCGICAVACPQDCIAMVAEEDVTARTEEEAGA